jgi:hypothetical protein
VLLRDDGGRPPKHVGGNINLCVLHALYAQVVSFLIITNQELSSLLSDRNYGAIYIVLATRPFYPDN